MNGIVRYFVKKGDSFVTEINLAKYIGKIVVKHNLFNVFYY